MKFYDREKELEILKKSWEQSVHLSMMTTLIGRRRTGKTSLLLKSAEKQRHLYLYVSKDKTQGAFRHNERQENHSDSGIYGKTLLTKILPFAY